MNANTNIAEYLKLCAKRLSVLWLMIAIVFPVVLIFAKIATPVQYTLTGTLTIQSDVMGESISDQYNISELSRSAALTSIALIENSDTVRKALEDSKIKAANLADFKKRVSVRQINDSNVLEITVVFDSDGVLGETFMANLMKEADFAIREKFANSNPSFSGAVTDAGRIDSINSPWLISFGVALTAVGITAAAFFIFNIFSFAADRTLRSSSKFETMTRIPVIAAIPPVARMIGTERSVNQVSNAYRVLRSAIKYSRRGVRSIAVCSPSPRDGRTSVAIGLSQALADTNAMVLLIEADMHRPNISRELRFDPVFGLGDLLLGKANLSCFPTRLPSRARWTEA